jgi:hypothetical protein
VAAVNPALAAATVGVSVWRKLIYSLIWQSVMWRPGKLRRLFLRFVTDRGQQFVHPSGYALESSLVLALSGPKPG